MIFPVEFNVPELITLPLASTENLLESETDKSKAPPIFKLPAITVFPVAPATVNLFVFKVKPPEIDVKLPRKDALPLISIFNLVSAKLPPEVGVSKFSLLKLVVNPSVTDVVYNTNGTFMLDIKTIELLNTFKSVEFIVSIDGFGELNEQVRSGSVWADTIERIFRS